MSWLNCFYLKAIFFFGFVEDQNSLITELLLFVLEIRRKLKSNLLKGMTILKKKKT